MAKRPTYFSATISQLRNSDAAGEIKMPFVYSGAPWLEGEEKVGGKDCVELVRHYTDLKDFPTWTWKVGDSVYGNPRVPIGTAIATFINGRYPNHSSGNHAALFLRQAANGIIVMDQWKDDRTKRRITARYIQCLGKTQSGAFVRPSDNADAFSVIET